MKPVPATVSAWVESLSGTTRPLVERLLQIIRRTAPHLEETIRWGSPAWKGRGLVCGIGAFKNHVTLVLWRGAEVGDRSGMLIHGQGRSPMRSAKFTALAQIVENSVASWITAAAALDGDEAKPKPKPPNRPEIPVPPALAAALAKNVQARRAFEAMPPSHRRDYSEWIGEAKQEATVARRVAKAIEKLSAGEGLNDKYRPVAEKQ